MMSQRAGFVYLADREISDLAITPGEAAAAVEEAILALARGDNWTAPKTAILPGDGRYFMSTLAASDDPPLMALKSAVLNPHNPERGLDTINATIVLLDSSTGQLRAVLDANWITAARTAAMSAVAARRLADPRSAHIAFVGCGVQALSHLESFAAMFPLKRASAFGRGKRNIDRICAAARDKGLAAHAVNRVDEAIADADIVVSSITATYDGPPFLDAGQLKPGAFAAITDLAVPWIAESMTAFSTVIIDDLRQEAAMATPMVAPGLVLGDLVGLLSGGIEAAFSPRARSAFVFRGVAIGDFALAALVYEKAMSERAGRRIER